jgi:hypothetical protein
MAFLSARSTGGTRKTRGPGYSHRAPADVSKVGDELDALAHFTCLKPSWVSLRSRSGAPWPNDSGSSFMS